MAAEQLLIEVTETGARVVKRNLEDIGKSADKSATALTSLKRLLGTIVTTAAIAQLLKYADTFTQIQNRLRVVVTSTQELTTTTQGLLDIANRTRSSFEATVDLYSRLANSSKQLGLGQKDLLEFTESVNKAIIISGAAASESEGGIRQLGQGLASGALRGDELVSVLENLPAVADIIAKQMGVTRGELRKLGGEGKVTADIIIEAFKNARGELDEKFAKTVPTLGQAFTVLTNNIVNWIGKMNEATGFTRGLANMIIFLSNNIEILGGVAVSVGAALLVAFGPKLLTSINAANSAMKLFTATLLANPITAIAVVITAAVTALFYFRDAIKLGVDETTTLGDVLRAVMFYLGQAFDYVYSIAKTLFDKALPYIKEFFGQIDFSLYGMLQVVAKVYDAYIGIVVGSYRASIAIYKGLPGAMKDIFIQAVNGAIGQVERLVNAAVDASNYLREKVGLDKFASVQLKQVENENAGAARDLGKIIASEFESGIRDSNAATGILNAVVAKAQEIGRARKAAEDAAGAGGGGGGGKGPAGDAEALKKLLDAFTQLEAKIDPTTAAMKEFTANEKILNDAVAAGLVTRTRALELLGLMRKQYEDTLDPIAALNRQLDEQVRLLGLSSKEREIQQQLKQIELALLAQGKVLGDQELQQLRSKLEMIQQLNVLDQVKQNIIQSTTGAQVEYNNTLAAANQLLLQGAINSQQYSKAVDDARIKLLDGQTDLASGIERSLLKIKQSYGDTATQIEGLMTNAFDGMSDALTNFVMTGKLDFKEFARSIIADLVKMIIKTLIYRAILSSLPGGGGVTAGTAPPVSADFTGPRFANGGISDSAGLAMVSEGRYKSEAHVPLPDGKSIPVSLKGDAAAAGAGMMELTINLYQGEGNEVTTSSRETERGKEISIMIGAVAENIAGGGVIDKTIRNVYPLARKPQ